MKTTKSKIRCGGMSAILVLAMGLMVCSAKVSEAGPMGTAFTYQGRLIDANKPADGLYDLQFKLFDDPCTGTQQGGPIDINDLDVIDGYFTVELDFGSDVFNGDVRWLETGVRPGDNSGGFTILSPRQEVTPVPYAIYAQTSGYAETAGGGISGSGTANYIAKFTGPNTLGDSAIYEEAGNVGIGTTNPESKLTVSGGGISIDNNWSLAFKTTSGNSRGMVYLTSSDNLWLGNYAFDGVNNIIFHIRDQGSDGVMRINNNGNVGIGTTEPDAKLEVDGDLKVTGAYRGNIGPNNGAPFPRPAYDSGWIPGTGGYVTLFHNIGGNVDNYVLDVQQKRAPALSIENWNYEDVTTNSVEVYFQSANTQLRVRIWVYN